MSRVTVVREANTVVVDGIAMRVDCSDLPDFFHAIQWDGAKGHIEFKPDSRGVQHGNLLISNFSSYGYLVDRWQVAKEENDRVLAAQEKAKQLQADEFERRKKVVDSNRKKRKVT